MAKTNTESIQDLTQELKDLYSNIKSADIDYQFIYGASSEDTLVVISNSEGPDIEFMKDISNEINQTLDKPCGFVLSDGPSEYEKYTTAYIRYDPENSYEYIIPACVGIELDDDKIPKTFGQIYSSSGNEGENAREMAAAYLYTLVYPSYDKEGSLLDKISSVMGVDVNNIKDNIPEAQNKLSSLFEQ